jgi:uncharacterized protein (TIRG00374 family)
VNQPSASPDETQPELPDRLVPQSPLRQLLSWLKWPVALSLIAWLGYQNREQFERILSGKQEVHWQFLAAAFALCMSSIVLTFFRWYLLVVALDFPFLFRDAVRLGFLGYLFNYVAPGAVGGDAIKAVVLANEQTSRRAVAVATILLDRILGLLALLMVGAGASLFVAADIEHRAKIVAVLWGGTFAGLLGLIVMLSPAARSRPVLALTKLPKVGGIVANLIDAVALYQSRRGVVILTVLISVVGHFGVISSFFLCALAVSSPEMMPGYVAHLFMIPLAEIFGVIVPLPGGVGALEYAVKESYEMAGANPEVGLLAAGVYRLTTIVIAIAGGGFYVMQKKRIATLLASDSD